MSGIAGQWESAVTTIVERPFPGVRRALVIAGADKRGTIYGIYDLSEQIGVSPWYWWADVRVPHADALYVDPGRYVQPAARNARSASGNRSGFAHCGRLSMTVTFQPINAAICTMGRASSPAPKISSRCGGSDVSFRTCRRPAGERFPAMSHQSSRCQSAVWIVRRSGMAGV